MNNKKLRKHNQEQLLAQYRQLPGWPKVPTVALARLQHRLISLQTKYDPALAGRRAQSYSRSNPAPGTPAVMPQHDSQHRTEENRTMTYERDGLDTVAA